MHDKTISKEQRMQTPQLKKKGTKIRTRQFNKIISVWQIRVKKGYMIHIMSKLRIIFANNPSNSMISSTRCRDKTYKDLTYEEETRKRWQLTAFPSEPRLIERAVCSWVWAGIIPTWYIINTWIKSRTSQPYLKDILFVNHYNTFCQP